MLKAIYLIKNRNTLYFALNETAKDMGEMKIKGNRTIKLSICTFFISCVGMIIIYALTKIYPFGSKSILTMDMSGQYVNYLAYFRNIFYDGANIFYDFSMNLGSNCYGLFAYYLSSPLNIIICFFKQEHITEAILLLNIIKVGLCATTMTIFLCKTTKLNKLSIIILSIMYSLMSYNIVYSQNIMWLDGVIYLPLVILGIENIIKKQKYGTYITSLFLVIVSNFYVGYMIGIFSVIYAIVRIINKTEKNNVREIYKENKRTIIVYIKGTIIALLLSMIILLPVIINLLNSKAEIETSNFSIDTYYTPLDAISKIIIGSFNNDQLAFGTPNIYCGTLCLLMAILYFVNPKIENKEKILYLFLIIGMILCFTIVPLNLIFHMLQSPVWFPFRNSFIFSFMLILLASKNMEKIRGIKFITLLKGQVLLVFISALLNKLNYAYITTTNTIITIIFVLITGIAYYYSEKQKKIYKIGLIILIMIEMILNGYQMTKQIGYVERESFVISYQKIQDTIEQYKSKENEFYRIENKVARSMNDPMLYHYNGFTHYSSTSGKDNKNFLTNFGIRHNLIPENSSNTTLSMSSLLGVKYYIADSKQISGQNLEWYNKVEENENITILENKYALNLGFLVSDKVKGVEIESGSPLKNQNELFLKMSDSQEKIFEEIEVRNFEQIENKNNEEMYLEYTIENASSTTSVKIYFDNILQKITSETNENSNNVIYVPKTIKNVKIEVNEQDKEKFKIKLYRFLEENFEKTYEIIKQNQLDVQENKSNYIKGTINAEKDGVLLTSIIDDKGWTVKVDGKKVEKQIVAENLLAIDLTKGEHTIEFSYIPTGFITGLVLFIMGIIALIFDNKKEILKEKRVTSKNEKNKK